MCGLFGGVSSFLSTDEVGYIKTLGIISSLRGEDSTGIALGYRHGKKKKAVSVSVLKDVVTPGELFQQNCVNQAMFKSSPFLIMGHCRSATIGDVNYDNAHPIVAGDIVGVHNGTIYNFRPTYGTGGSDSNVLFSKLAEKGIESVVQEADGAFALVWIDKAKNTLNFLRNDQRTLFFMSDIGNTTVLWASEESFLRFIKERFKGLATWKDPVALPVDVHCHFSLETTSNFLFKMQHLKKKAKEVESSALIPFQEFKGTQKEKTSLPVVTSVPAQTSVPVQTGRIEKPVTQVALTDQERANRRLIAEAARKARQELGDEKALYKGFQGIAYGIQYAEARLGCGCVMCSAQKSIEDTVFWIAKEDYFCEACYNDPSRRELHNGSSYKSAIIGDLAKYREMVKEAVSNPFKDTTVH
jgi:asparagine synthetase B (glutamine-hydrolysing)